jgi:gamma-polyglutamate biosynthesis protein CapA
MTDDHPPISKKKKLLAIVTMSFSFFLFSMSIEAEALHQMQTFFYGTETAIRVELMKYKNEEAKQKDYEEVTIVAFGDMMLGRYVRTLMERNGHDYPFEHIPELVGSMLPENLDEPDFLFANLEGPISDNTYVNPGTAMRFNFKPDVTEMLNKYGFNLLSLANNHAYDMGEKGAFQTRQYLQAAKIHYFGDAQSVKEETTWTTTIKDTTITFVGLNDTVYDHLDYEAATARIAEVEAESDFTIVSIHWGNEYWDTPTDEQVNGAHAFVDAGADVIIGHHPHIIASSEWYHSRPIYYSLGNFIFDQYFQQNVQEGLGLTITLKKPADETKLPVIKVETTEFDILASQPQVRE